MASRSFPIFHLLLAGCCKTEEGRQRVEFAQSSLVSALALQLEATHPHDDSILPTLIQIIKQLKQFNSQISESMKNATKIYKVDYEKIPPLTRELLDPTSQEINGKLAELLQKL